MYTDEKLYKIYNLVGYLYECARKKEKDEFYNLFCEHESYEDRDFFLVKKILVEWADKVIAQPDYVDVLKYKKQEEE